MEATAQSPAIWAGIFTMLERLLKILVSHQGKGCPPNLVRGGILRMSKGAVTISDGAGRAWEQHWPPMKATGFLRMFTAIIMKRYSCDFRGSVEAMLRGGASAQAEALRLELSPAKGQKWAKDQAMRPKKLASSQLETETALLEAQVARRLAADSAGSSGVNPNSNSPNCPSVLLFGYWPPTDCLDMLSDYSSGKPYRGYLVQSFSSYFDMLGWQAVGSVGNPPPGGLVPWWSVGCGKYPLFDYRSTADFFWIGLNVPAINPVAIMSFSRGGARVNPVTGTDFHWSIEPSAYNYATTDWQTGAGIQYYPLPASTYPPPRGVGIGPGTGTLESVTPLDRPYIGGSSDDPSPYNGIAPSGGNPPNPRQCAGDAYDSNLPSKTIINAINVQNIVNAEGIPITADAGDKDELGYYVSAYMAYLVCWYGRDEGVKPPSPLIRFYGHTSVGMNIEPYMGREALQVQLDAVIDALGTL